MASIESRINRIEEEYIADRRGRIRQAGTIDPDGTSPDKLRYICEKSLYYFCVIILGRHYLTSSLHRPACNWLSKIPSYRKMLLWPRRHAKTSIVSHGLPPHILIQPLGGRYLPWKPGCDTRILLAGETAPRAVGNLKTIRSMWENNDLFRGLWPHLVWENPRRQGATWNDHELEIPRNEDYPDPSIRAIGVGGAITGARHDVHIKDDLVAEEAANSEVVMQGAIDWHINSRALFDEYEKSLEYIIGTRWAVRDLYSHILETDVGVSSVVRSIVEDGVPIYPEAFTLELVEKLKVEFGTMFPLLYMNNIGDPDLIDFPLETLRTFAIQDDMCYFDGDLRDSTLEESQVEKTLDDIIPRGGKLDAEALGGLADILKEQHLRARSG